MRTLIFSFFFICNVPFLSVNATEGEYSILKISPALLKNANAVKRIEQINFTIYSKTETILKKKYAITILNEKGDEHASFIAYYDKLHEVKNIEGALFDAMGNEVKRLKNKQIIDIGATDNHSLVDDNRKKMHHFYHKQYPYTVEYEVEEKYNGTLFFPIWIPRDNEFVSVEQSSITITSPLDYLVRVKTFNYEGKPLEMFDKSTKSSTWQIKMQPAIISEYAMPHWLDINTAVYFGPSQFQIEHFTGNMSTWADFGKFINSLKQGKDILPVHLQQTVKQLTEGVQSNKEKVEILYTYLQKNTRYISIQLGIGGWQPYDAAYVANNAYGDCKALTNFMYSLLKEAGIRSCYTLVSAGKRARKIIADFPAQQFNHVILCVPLQTDTIWLECTSQTLPAGYLSEFTYNRYALAIDEDGGKLVRTPNYGMIDNSQIRKLKVNLDTEGNLYLHSSSVYSGLQQDQYHDLINNLDKDKVKEILQHNLDFATYEIAKFNYKEHKAKIPHIEESLEIMVSNYATITGKRLFIVPNIMTRTNRKLPMDSTRQFNLALSMAYKDVDTAEIILPSGYYAESIPQDIILRNQFGSYQSSVKLVGDNLYYYRLVEHNSGNFPASSYTELVQFYEKMYKADRAKVVLIKKQEPIKF
jgi:hypothetical protein